MDYSFLQPSKRSSSVFSHNSTKGDKLPFYTYCILQSFFLCPSLKFHSALETSSENILFSPIFILSFHLIDTITFHNNYIITNNSMSFPCGSPVAVNGTVFSLFSNIHLSPALFIGMMKLLPLTKAKRASREGGGKRMS